MIFDFFRFVKYGKLIVNCLIIHICSRYLIKWKGREDPTWDVSIIWLVYLRVPFHFVLILSYSLVSKNSCMLILSQSRLDSRIRLQDCPVVSDPKYEITVPWSKSAIKPTIDLLELPPDIFIVHFMTQLFG